MQFTPPNRGITTKSQIAKSQNKPLRFCGDTAKSQSFCVLAFASLRNFSGFAVSKVVFQHSQF